MGLQYNILNNKPIVSRDGEQFLDLATNVFNTNLAKTGQVIQVNKYYVARPDLISLALYGDDRYADIICKINGISNPFELNEDDVIMVPNIEYVMDCMVHSPKGSEFVDENNDSTAEISVPVNTLQKRKNEKRSPNEQVIGDSIYTIDKTFGVFLY